MLSLKKFRGGVHPDGHKDDSSALPIFTKVPIPSELVLPLCQHAGEDATPLVKPGQRVLKGEKIANATARLSANVHAPTSGTIRAIEQVTIPHPSGLTARAIIIDPDGKDEWIELNPPADPYAVDQDVLASLVEEAGIVGMGGAIFPSAVKLRQGRRFEIKTLIVNGSECEPYLTCDDRLMRERAEEIVEGTKLVRHIIEAYRAVIAVEDNKPEALAALEKAAENIGSIEVVAVPARYPMGSAKQLIQTITGQEVPAGARSNDIGVLVHNVGTVYAIYQALVFGRPLISRVATIAGDCVGTPRNVEALIGTPLQHLFDVCGGIVKPPAKLIIGGPMMGQEVPHSQMPLIKGTTGVLALTRAEVNAEMASPCIRCGRCVSACPMGLLPLEMARGARQDNFDMAQASGLKDCILCGSCAYVCPSHIPLVQYFEYARGELRDRRESEQKLVRTAELANAREARVTAEKAAKEAAKQAAKAAKEAAKAAKKKQQAEKQKEAASVAATDEADDE